MNIKQYINYENKKCKKNCCTFAGNNTPEMCVFRFCSGVALNVANCHLTYIGTFICDTHRHLALYYTRYNIEYRSLKRYRPVNYPISRYRDRYPPPRPCAHASIYMFLEHTNNSLAAVL